MSDGPDRAVVESDLEADELDRLRHEAEDLGLPPERWWSVPTLRDYATLRAATARLQRYEAAGYSWTRSTELASEMVGRSPTYLRVLIHRARENERTATGVA